MPGIGLPGPEWNQPEHLRRWIVVDDPATIAMLGALYKSVVAEHSKALTSKVVGVPGEAKVLESAMSLLNIIDKVPAMLIPWPMPGRPEGKSAPGVGRHRYGSIIQATWSFFPRCANAGSARFGCRPRHDAEREASEILRIPFDQYTQIGWFPIAYTIGTDFKKAWRKPVSEVRSFNKF